MKRFSTMLLPLLIGSSFFMSGCDSDCCATPQKQKKEPANPINQEAPVAVIDLVGNVATNGECTPGDTIALVPKSTDSDGTIAQNIWKVDGQVVGNTQIVCPDDTQTKTICLTAVDNDGLQSEEVCKVITGKEDTIIPPTNITTPPVSLIYKGTVFDDGQELNCDKVHDTDTIDTDGVPNIYGSDQAIKTITWTYTYYKAGDVIESGPFTKTQAEYNQEHGLPEGACKKWFHTYGGVEKIKFSLTTLDDDDETNTTKYVFTVADGKLTEEE